MDLHYAEIDKPIEEGGLGGFDPDVTFLWTGACAYTAQS